MPRGLKECVAVGTFVVLLLVPTPYQAQSATSASTTRTFTSARLELTVVGTEIALPAGLWQVASVAPANVLDQVFVVPQTPPDETASRRVLAAQIQRGAESQPWPVQTFFPALQDYAGMHGGVGPNSLNDLDRQKFGYLITSLDHSPWPDDAGKPLVGPFFFVVPATPIVAPAGPQGPRRARMPLLLELRPFLDDGKHWVLLSDGSVERVPIDAALIAKYHLTMSFVRPKGSMQVVDANTNVRHAVLGLLRNPGATTATLALTDTQTGRRAEVHWMLAGGRQDRQVMAEWATVRESEWLPLIDHADAGILRAWISRSADLYGATPMTQPMSPAALAERSRSTDAFSLFGGRAAMRETLQMQLLRSQAPTRFDAGPSAISTLKGVEVASLPFDRLLAGRQGGRIALADAVPADRFLVYFAKPSAVFPFLDKGGDFLARAGSVFTSSAYDDDLKSRYLRRLGLVEGASRRFLESGEVTELALVTSDLFFIDGTDLTLIMHVRSGDAVAATLRTFGIVDLKLDGITEKPTASGRSASWARQGDVVYLSTSRKELDRMLGLAGNPSAASLGRSAEFRYMLTELPVKAETRAFVYFSDPFIRRMVGPALKIGQLRRMLASADMSMISAGALLYRLDGHQTTPDLATLISLGYVSRNVVAQNYRLQDNLSAVSAEWGSLAELAPIDTASIDTVTPAEAQAYQTYVNEYKQYWRQYFDPIALRLDDAPDGALELSSFILPLIDSQMYNSLRSMVATRERGTPLRVPVVTPEPVLQLSMNLTDESWVTISGSLHDVFSQYTGINPALFDVLGPGLHLAIQDSDPIITLGASDLLGAFGGATLGAGLGTNFAMSFAASVLTRPCKIFVELQDPKRAVEMLRQATRTGIRTQRPAEIEFRQVEGRDAWIYTFGVPGVATIRLGLEVQNGYLVFSNIPWSQPVTVPQVEARDLNGAALRVAPYAVRQGLAGLFATQAEQDQTAALASLAELLPLLQAGGIATPDAAAAMHATIFGSRPQHPGNGTWLWKDGQLESSAFGNATRWKTPVYKPEAGDFGLFNGVAQLNLNMQFETGGLRAICRWVFKDGEGPKRRP
jgi:hypothetical protein